MIARKATVYRLFRQQPETGEYRKDTRVFKDREFANGLAEAHTSKTGCRAYVIKVKGTRKSQATKTTKSVA